MFLVLITLFFKITPILTTDYCSLCPDQSHTLCKYPAGPAPNCINYNKIPIKNNLKSYIVDIHNDIRNHIASGQETKGKLGKQPSAANMMIMTWDNELAEIAQRWADQCISINSSQQHDVCKKTNKFDIVGQNILTAITNSTALPELAILILTWYKQVANVIPSDVEFFSGIKRGQYLIGQYTQLVWATTTHVGCGIAIYKEEGSDYYDQRLVCNYGPGGNILGQPIYEIGPPCTKCPTQKCDLFRKSLCKNTTFTRYKRQVSDEKRSDLCVYTPGDNATNIKECFNFPNVNCVTDVTDSESLFKDLLDYDIYSPSEGEYKRVLNKFPWVLNLTIDYTNYMEMENRIRSINKPSYLKLGEFLFTNKSLKNKIDYKKMGKWYKGRCRCDKVYRSAISSEVRTKKKKTSDMKCKPGEFHEENELAPTSPLLQDGDDCICD